jgi:hypothetical protein
VIDPVVVGTFFMSLYSYAWFVGFGVAFVLYALLMRKKVNQVVLESSYSLRGGNGIKLNPGERVKNTDKL